MMLAVDLQGTQLGTEALEGSLGQLAAQTGALLAALTSGATGSELGSVGGVNVTVGQSQLTTSDDQLLGTLQTLANQGGSQSGSARRWSRQATATQAPSVGCLALEAAALLSDNSNHDAAAFAADMASLFQAAQTSPACQQPGAAEAAAAILNGAAATALAILSQAGNPLAGLAIPAQALAYADLGPAGELISIALALAQTSDQNFEAVLNSFETFNQAAASELMALISQTIGELLNLYQVVSQTAGSLDSAIQVFDGVYAGTFTGAQFFTGGNSCAISGALGFNALGPTITTTAPAVGGGTLDNNRGNFTVTSVGGPGVSCMFNGTFSVDSTGAVSASGTWSCAVSTPTPAGFTSANGSWSASRLSL